MVSLGRLGKNVAGNEARGGMKTFFFSILGPFLRPGLSASRRDHPFEARVLVRVAWLWTLGVHVTLWVFEARGRVFWGDENRYLASAQAFLKGNSNWWPEPLWPPLQSEVLAGILKISGGRLWVIGIFQGLLLLLVALLLGDLIRRWSGSASAGRVAFWLCLSYPPLVAFTHYLWPEILHLGLMLICVWILAMRSDSRAWCGLAGVALGLALLTKSLLGPFIPILLLGALWRREKPLAKAMVLLAMMMLTILPVEWKQYERLGRPMIADSSAFNLWVGLNDRGLKNFEDEYVARAYVDYQQARGDFFQRRNELWSRSFALIRDQGIVRTLKTQICRQYFRLFDKENYLGEQLLEGAAVVQGLGYDDGRGAIALILRGASWFIYGLLLFLFPFSVVLYRWKEGRWPLILLGFLAYNLLIFFWFHVKSRYRIQLLPVFFLGAPLLSQFFFGLRREFFNDSVFRRVSALLMGFVLLFLAFGGAWVSGHVVGGIG